MAINFSHLTNSLTISATGMKSQEERMSVIAQNIANAHVRGDSPGGNPYQRKMTLFKSVLDRKRDIEYLGANKVVTDPRPFKFVFDPSHPAANEKGYVKESNVDKIVELADMKEANRAHEANTKVFQTVLNMIQNLNSILKI